MKAGVENLAEEKVFFSSSCFSVPSRLIRSKYIFINHVTNIVKNVHRIPEFYCAQLNILRTFERGCSRKGIVSRAACNDGSRSSCLSVYGASCCSDASGYSRRGPFHLPGYRYPV